MEMLNFPLFDENWTAEDELLLIDGLEMFGMGNWEQVADHVGTKTREECYDHYLAVFVQSEAWPAPVSLPCCNVRQEV
jgi:transcriptional adapter 2-alpha